jgi:leucyl-tRNA synthetase
MFPTWQEKYIDLVRGAFDAINIAIDDKALNAEVAKLGEMKKAMPFVQNLKKRLVQNKEPPEAIFERKLSFDEFEVLSEIVGSVKRITGCREIEIVAIDEGGKTGTVVGTGEHRDGLAAENAVPGQPSFFFANIVE